MLVARRKQQGISLVEVMVAALVITLGLMGIVNLQVKNQAQAFMNYQRTLAGLHAQDLQAILRADTCVIKNGINEQHKQWQENHFKNTKTNWTSSLEPASVDAAVEAVAKDKGYWSFELIIKPNNIEKNKIQQTLIVQYKDGCS